MKRLHALTKTDPAIGEWAIDDHVVQLREWATGVIHRLPELPVNDCTVGSAEICTIRLNDPSGRVSRLHAQLIRNQLKWILRDVGSKNGVRIDGARRSEIVLEPGLEIGIGGITLIAESGLSIGLRNFLARLLGWCSDRTEIVDHALRSVRMAATRRVALVLCGDGDLVPLARSIHRHVRGTSRPFILGDPRRRRSEATVRSAEGYATGLEALAAATGGTLCVRSQRLPPDFDRVIDALRSPNSQVQLTVCAESQEDCELYRVRPIVIPPIASRKAELDLIIDEYAYDAMEELAIFPTEFPAADRKWVREYASTSLSEIEKATLRLVALRASRNLSNAAERLGMAAVSLSRWIGRRVMPMKIVP